MSLSRAWASLRNISGELLSAITPSYRHEDPVVVQNDSLQQVEALQQQYLGLQQPQSAPRQPGPCPGGTAFANAIWDSACESDRDAEFPAAVPSTAPGQSAPMTGYQALQTGLSQPQVIDSQGPSAKPSAALTFWGSLKNLHVFSFPFTSLLEESSQGRLQQANEAAAAKNVQQDLQFEGVPHHSTAPVERAESSFTGMEDTGISGSELQFGEVRQVKGRKDRVERYREKKRRRVEAQQQARTPRERSLTPPPSPLSTAGMPPDSDFEFDYSQQDVKLAAPRTGRRIRHAHLPEDVRKAQHVMAHRASAARSNAKKKALVVRAQYLDAVVQPLREGLLKACERNIAIRDALLVNCPEQRHLLAAFLDKGVMLDALLEDQFVIRDQLQRAVVVQEGVAVTGPVPLEEMPSFAESHGMDAEQPFDNALYDQDVQRARALQMHYGVPVSADMEAERESAAKAAAASGSVPFVEELPQQAPEVVTSAGSVGGSASFSSIMPTGTPGPPTRSTTSSGTIAIQPAPVSEAKQECQKSLPNCWWPSEAVCVAEEEAIAKQDPELAKRLGILPLAPRVESGGGERTLMGGKRSLAIPIASSISACTWTPLQQQVCST